MFNHSPKVRTLVNRLALLSLTMGMITMVIIFFYYSNQLKANRVSCREWLADTIMPLEFKAKITDIQEGDKKLCMKIFQLDLDSPDFLEVCECSGQENFLKQASIGDSLLKKSGESTLYLWKSNGQGATFDYPCCE